MDKQRSEKSAASSNSNGSNSPNLETRLDGVRVLLVDDDVDARQMLNRVLQNCGAITLDADSMSQALSSIQTFDPDILLSDLGMPEHDGYELIRRIRGMGPPANELPAIALTGFARPDDRQRALLAGFQVHVAKPVDPRELTAAIATLVGRARG
jgi:CheY-like chemotaxis protein